MHLVCPRSQTHRRFVRQDGHEPTEHGHVEHFAKLDAKDFVEHWFCDDPQLGCTAQ